MLSSKSGLRFRNFLYEYFIRKNLCVDILSEFSFIIWSFEDGGGKTPGSLSSRRVEETRSSARGRLTNASRSSVASSESGWTKLLH